MTIETLLYFVLTEALLSASPGPAVLLVIGLSMRFDARTGVAAAAGVIATNAVYFALAAFGVGALILASATLFTIVKWVGAAYLVYLGVQMALPLIRRLASPAAENAHAIDLSAAARSAAGDAVSLRRAFWRGFSVQAANPKNIAFFVAILPQFVTPSGDVATQLLILGVASVALELPILAMYALAFSRLARLLRETVVLWIEGVAGGLLIALGAALAIARREA